MFFNAVLILLPLRKFCVAIPDKNKKWRVGFYFLALGLAFLFIEIAFINKFILFLSHPLYAVSSVLSAFLVFAGFGSGCSKRFERVCQSKGRCPIKIAVLGIITIAGCYLFFLPLLFKGLMPLPGPAKMMAAIILIGPLAFFMGLPFPLGLSRVGKVMPELIPWAWGINGCASALSAILATILAIHFGFNRVIFLALLLYLFAASAFDRSFIGGRNRET